MVWKGIKKLIRNVKIIKKGMKTYFKLIFLNNKLPKSYTFINLPIYNF